MCGSADDANRQTLNPRTIRCRCSPEEEARSNEAKILLIMPAAYLTKVTEDKQGLTVLQPEERYIAFPA
jgi:hypothetical protein